jgi:hypothetical protein
MSAVSAKAFTKTRACPSSEDISRRRLPRSNSDQIARHVAGCEFCAAEQSFLSVYIPTTEEYKIVAMPAHLRRLAEALLIGKLKDQSRGSKYSSGLSVKKEPGFALNQTFVPGV